MTSEDSPIQSWDSDSELDYERWLKNSTPGERDECERFWAIYFKDIVDAKGEGFTEAETYYESSLDNIDVCIYRVKGKNNMCFCVGITENKVRIVTISKCNCNRLNKCPLANQRIKEWKVRR